MPQWFRLDRPVGVAYLALGLAGCVRAQPALAPAGMGLVEPAQVAQWVARTTPTRGAMHRFTWLYQDEQASKGGRGSVRIAPPDSLRFDFAGSLGIGKGTAAVIGDSAIWVVPDRSVDELVPGIALLWAVLGVAETPPEGARLLGLEADGKAAWQYQSADDTVTYVSWERGEIKVLLINHGPAPVAITHAMRIAQLVIAPVLRATLVAAETLDETARGDGGFGSTGLQDTKR